MKTIKSAYTLAFMILLTFPLSAQNWIWAKGFTDSAGHGDGGAYITLHPNGNLYCNGQYGLGGTVTADTATIIFGGNTNCYITSFNQSGSFLGITNVPSVYNPPNIVGIWFTGRPAVDDSGYLYNSLQSQGVAIVDTINVRNYYNTSLLSKWNSDDRCMWVKPFVSLYKPVFYNGHLYCLGSYQQPSLTIDSITLYDPVNKTQGYITKLDKQGNCVWAKQAAGGNTSFGQASISNNHIYQIASSDSCFAYDTINICGQNGHGVSVLLQTDTNGAVKWAINYNSADHLADYVSVTVDANGNSYLTGGFDTTFYMGNYVLTKTGSEIYDLFIAKLDSTGKTLWVKAVPVSNSLYLVAEHTDSYGNTYLMGRYSGTIVFGRDTITAQTQSDFFITRYSPSGNCMGGVTVANAGAGDITEDSEGNAYVTGEFLTSATFGSTTLIGSQYGDFFVAKLSAITDSATSEMTLLPNDSLLQIYANPSRGLFTVVIPQSVVQASNGNLTVYDSQGSTVTNQTVDISTNHLQVDLGLINRGVYTVLLTANGKQFTGRVVIQ